MHISASQRFLNEVAKISCGRFSLLGEQCLRQSKRKDEWDSQHISDGWPI